MRAILNMIVASILALTLTQVAFSHDSRNGGVRGSASDSYTGGIGGFELDGRIGGIGG